MDWGSLLQTGASAAATYYTGGMAGGAGGGMMGGGMMGGDEKKGGAASSAKSGDITAGPVSSTFGDFNIGAYKSGAGSATGGGSGALPSWVLPVVATVALGAVALLLKKR